MSRPDHEQYSSRAVSHDVIFGRPGPTVTLSGHSRAIAELGAAIRQDSLIVQPHKPENAGQVLLAVLRRFHSKDAIPSLERIKELGDQHEAAEDNKTIPSVQCAVQPTFALKELNVDKILTGLRRYQSIHKKRHVCQLGILSKLDRDEEHLVYLLPTLTHENPTDTVWLFRECRTIRGREEIEESWRSFIPRDEEIETQPESETVEDEHKFPEDLLRRIEKLRQSRQAEQKPQIQQQHSAQRETYFQRDRDADRVGADYESMLSTRDSYDPSHRLVPQMPNTNLYISPLHVSYGTDFDLFPSNDFTTAPPYQYHGQVLQGMPAVNYAPEDAPLLPQYDQHAGWFEDTTFQINAPAESASTGQVNRHGSMPRRISTRPAPRRSRDPTHKPTEAEIAASTDEDILSGAVHPKYIVGPVILRLAMRYSNTEIGERCNAHLAKPLSSNLYTKRITKALKDAHGHDQATYDRVRKEFDAKRKRNGVNINMSRVTGAFDEDALGKRKISREEMVARQDGRGVSRRGGMYEPTGTERGTEGRAPRPRAQMGCPQSSFQRERGQGHGAMKFDEDDDDDFKQSLSDIEEEDAEYGFGQWNDDMDTK